MIDPTPDPTLPEPSDPWAGRAALPSAMPAPAPVPLPVQVTAQAVRTVVVPQVVYVERRRSKRWPWVLGITLGLALLCCGAGSAVLAPITGQWPAHVSIGARPGGFVRDTSAPATLIGDQVARRMKADLPVEGAFAAKLDDPRDGNRWILLLGATRLILDPSKELDQAIKQSTKSMQLSDVHKVNPGSYGGDVRCASGRDDRNTPIRVCAWIDHGSEALGLFYGRWSVGQAAAAFVTIREAVLTRG